MEWINQNKEWFLSGAGIFMISSLVSFVSVILTLWMRAKAEGNQQKKLCISRSVTKFSIPAPDGAAGISNDGFMVSYKGNQFRNLCLFSVQITNTGKTAIQSQRLHLIFPPDANIVDAVERKGLPSISINKKEAANDDDHEIVYEIERLEPNDIFSVYFIVDTDKSDALRCEPRGVDNIEYTQRGEVEKSELSRLVFFASAFVMANAIPWLGSLIQALIVLAAAPLLIQFVRQFSGKINPTDNNIHINGDLVIGNDGNLVIEQGRKS